MTVTRMILVWSIVVGMMITSVAAGDVADPDPNRFEKEIADFAAWDSKNATPADPVLFVGSSSIRMWKTHDSFPQLPVINRGFGGSHISDVIHFFDRVVAPYAAKVIVFYAGDNDVAGGKPATQVVRDYRRFVTMVHRMQPRTSIIFITIKPSGSRWSLWPQMNEANQMIKALSEKDPTLFFADLGTPLLKADGIPDDGLFRNDRLHLNAKGYQIWTQTLRPVIEKALKAAAPK